MTRPLCRNCGRPQATAEDCERHFLCCPSLPSRGCENLCWDTCEAHDWPAEVARLKERIAEISAAADALATATKECAGHSGKPVECPVCAAMRNYIEVRSRGGAAREG